MMGKGHTFAHLTRLSNRFQVIVRSGSTMIITSFPNTF